MDKINVKRMWDFTLWSLREERDFCLRATVAATIGMAVLLFVVNLGIESFMRLQADDMVPQMMSLTEAGNVANVTMLVVFMFGTMIMLGLALSFRRMDNKRHSIAFLMLPASNAEKFLSRMLLVVGGGSLMFLVAAGVGDALRMALVKIIFGECNVGYLLPSMGRCLGEFVRLSADYAITGVAPNLSQGTSGVLFYNTVQGLFWMSGRWLLPYVLLDLLFSLAFMLCAGALFRRYAWILSFVLVGLFEALLWHTLGTHWAVTAVIHLVGVVALSYLAYRIYTRMQVINNRIVNL